MKEVKNKAVEVTDRAEKKVKDAQELKHKKDKEEIEHIDESEE